MKSFATVILFSLITLVSRMSSAVTSVSHELTQFGSSKNKVEFFWKQPKGKGPWPVLVMIHPHQEWPDKIGAEVFVKNNSLEFWSDKGFLVIAVSQPGYGKSEGSPDFCGPASQQAVMDVIQSFRQRADVMAGNIFLYGGSRGAVIASMIATKDPLLAGVILKSGLYDLVSAYQAYPWWNMIKLNMIWELGFYDEAKLKERSALYTADQIKAPLLIIHGSEDDRASVENAQTFANKVKSNGGNVDLVVLSSEHMIPMEKVKADMDKFLKNNLEIPKSKGNL